MAFYYTSSRTSVSLVNLAYGSSNWKITGWFKSKQPSLEWCFSTRDITTMLTLFKSLVLSRLDYASQLWSPHLVKHIDQLEKIQRSFTKHITGMQGLDYSDRLVFLKLHSLQRRRERYCIIYVWKIIEGLVPNFSNPIVCSYSDRRGRSCIVSHVHVGRLGTLAFNSFRWRAIRLLNAMPNHIRIKMYFLLFCS